MSTQSKTYSNYQTQRIISVTHPEPAHLPSSPHHTTSMMSFDIEKPDGNNYQNERSSRAYRTVRIPIIKKDVRKSWAITGIVLLCIVLGLVIIGVAVGTTSKSDPEVPRPTDTMDPVPNSATAGRPVIWSWISKSYITRSREDVLERYNLEGRIAERLAPKGVERR